MYFLVMINASSILKLQYLFHHLILVIYNDFITIIALNVKGKR